MTPVAAGALVDQASGHRRPQWIAVRRRKGIAQNQWVAVAEWLTEFFGHPPGLVFSLQGEFV